MLVTTGILAKWLMYILLGICYTGCALLIIVLTICFVGLMKWAYEIIKKL